VKAIERAYNAATYQCHETANASAPVMTSAAISIDAEPIANGAIVQFFAAIRQRLFIARTIFVNDFVRIRLSP